MDDPMEHEHADVGDASGCCGEHCDHSHHEHAHRQGHTHLHSHHEQLVPGCCGGSCRPPAEEKALMEHAVAVRNAWLERAMRLAEDDDESSGNDDGSTNPEERAATANAPASEETRGKVLFDDDLLRSIMGCLLPHELSCCAETCSFWRSAALQDAHWKRLAEELCASKAPRYALTSQRAAVMESAATFRCWRDEFYRMDRDGARDAIAVSELTSLTFTFRFRRERPTQLPVRRSVGARPPRTSGQALLSAVAGRLPSTPPVHLPYNSRRCSHRRRQRRSSDSSRAG